MEYLKMDESHVGAIAELEKMCFNDPWSIHSISSELNNPLSTWLVAVEGGVVCGYVGSQSVLDGADMMNIAVHPDYRKQGIGYNLVDKLIDLLKAKDVISLSLEVRVSNENAINLYNKMGFEIIGKRPGYYRNPREDAYIMRKEFAK
jgi:ribosomal-protein-alanine N-acetyltransferase